jgi:hypothetical protein
MPEHVVEESTTPREFSSEPRFVPQMAWSQNRQPRSSGWGGDLRAFLMEAIDWTHGPKPATGWATRFYAPTSKHVAEPSCESSSTTRAVKRAAKFIVRADAALANCTLPPPE